MGPSNEEVLIAYHKRSSDKDFIGWLINVVPKAKQISSQTILKRIKSLKEIRTKLSRKGAKDHLQNVLSDEYDPDISMTSFFKQQQTEKENSIPILKKGSQAQNYPSQPKRSKFSDEVGILVDRKLVEENTKLVKENQSLKSNNELLQTKLKKIRVGRFNQAIIRKEAIITRKKNKIESLESQLKDERKSLKELQRSLNRANKDKDLEARRSKAAETRVKSKSLLLKAIRMMTKRREEKAESKQAESKSVGSQMATTIKDLQAKVKDLTHEIIRRDVESEDSMSINGKKDGCFSREVRLCCYNLLCHNVGITHVGPIIQFTVEVLTGKVPFNLPSKSEVAVMQREVGVLAKAKVGEVLIDQKNLCIHSDGTEDKGKKLATAQISSSQGTFDIGLKEIVSGSSENYFDFLLRSLREVEACYETLTETTGSRLMNKIISNTRACMTDRHVVEANVNLKLQEYRKELLPETLSNWEGLTELEKGNHSYTYSAVVCDISFSLILLQSSGNFAQRWVIGPQL